MMRLAKLRQRLQLTRILLDPRVTVRPLQILRELRRRGVQRVPDGLLGGARARPPRRDVIRFVQRWLDGERLTRHRGQWVLNSFIPPFPGPGYLRMFENLLSGRHLSPVSAFLALTAACGYRCPHCSAVRPPGEGLSTAAWQSAIGQLKELGASIIGLTGGEPTLRPDLEALVSCAAGAGCATILFSSGEGLANDPGLAARLRRAGLWGCCISLDAADASAHDRQRGHAGAFEAACAAVRLSRRTGFYTMAASLATRDFVERREFERVYALARRLGCDEYRLVEPMPCGRLAGAACGDLLTPEQTAGLRRFHVETNRRGRLPKVCAFNQVESPEVFGCGAGTQHLYIDAAGNVCPCDFTPLAFGNVQREPLAAIWRRMNVAMGNNPRRHCFIQRYHHLLRPHLQHGLPLPPNLSETICRQAAPEPLPDYFAMVMQGREP
ncbi:MAG: Antilisterial bacteriocin subtilosin biosynthesis protein AlbA [Lentisphaerae bacterium ADurb.BinA184]|nr:MAG: Antilisterial bacteriocin subtilosin biosynthesis protein AlbA [Lentisphaerae bacterium ADurb.BinA184]